MADHPASPSSIHLEHFQGPISATLHLPKSKSMVNRALLLAALFPQITLSGMSTSKDSDYLDWALKAFNEDDLFVGAGGTTLRFAMAYWAVQPGANVILRGTEALNKRPIAALVEALNAMGAEISYAEQAHRAPVKIAGRAMRGGTYNMGHVESSQFITALMLIAPTFENGLDLRWDSAPSQPYLMMTAALLREAGIEVELTHKSVRIAPGQSPIKKELHMEPDWSAVAFGAKRWHLANKRIFSFLALRPIPSKAIAASKTISSPWASSTPLPRPDYAWKKGLIWHRASSSTI